MTRSRNAVRALLLASAAVAGSGLSSASFAQGSASSGGGSSSSESIQGCGGDFDSVAGTPPQDNMGPVRNAAVEIRDQKVVGGGAELRYTIPEDAFTDADVAAGKGDVLCYRATGMPSWLSFKPNTRTFRGSPETRHIDGDVPVEITVTVRDSANERASDTFTVTVVGNRAPIAPTFPDVVDVHEGKTFRFAIPDARDSGLRHPDAPDDPALSGTVALSPATEHFSDPDGDALSYWIRSKPDWVVFDERERTVVGNADAGDIEAVTPNGEGARIAEVSIYASDGSAHVEWTLLLRLNGKDSSTTTPPPARNHPPKPGEAIAPVSFTETGVRAFAIPANAFVDPDGDELSLRIPSLPPWLSFDAATETLTADWEMYYLFEGAAKNDAQGGHPATVVVIATDPSMSWAQATFTVNMVVANSGPTRNVPIQAQRAAEGVPFEFSVPVDAFEDIEGDALVFTTDEAVDWLGFDGKRFYGTPGPGDITDKVRTVGIIATDALGRSARTMFELAMNRPPTLGSGVPDIFAEGGRYFVGDFPADAFLDPDGDTLTYSAYGCLGIGNWRNGWCDENGGLPFNLRFDIPSRRFLGYIPPESRATYIVVKAADPYGGAVEDIFAFTANRPPQVDRSFWFSDKAVTRGLNHSWTLRAVDLYNFRDPDGDALTYSVSGLPSWLTFDPATKAFSGYLSEDNAVDPRVSTITVTASDRYGGSVSRAFELTSNHIPVGADEILTVSDEKRPTAGIFLELGNVLENDTDLDGDALSVGRFRHGEPNFAGYASRRNSFALGDFGALEISPSGDARYRGYTWSVGGTSEEFAYEIDDGHSTSTAVLTVTFPSGGLNHAPVAGGVVAGDIRMEFGGEISWSPPEGTFSDLDGDPLTYTAPELPPWLSLDSATGEISVSQWSEAQWQASPRDFSIRLTATDPHGASDWTWLGFQLVKPRPEVVMRDETLSLDANLDSVGINVLANEHYSAPDPLEIETYWHGKMDAIPPTRIPYEDRAYAGDDSELAAGDYGSLKITTSGAATYVRGPGANAIPAGETRTDRFVYEAVVAGTRYLGTVAVTVFPNEPPTVGDGIEDKIVARGSYHEWTLPTGALSDPEGDTLTYDVRGLPSWLDFDAATRIFSGTLESDNEADPRISRITITATDKEGRAASAEFELTSNQAPVGRNDGIVVPRDFFSFERTLNPDLFRDDTAGDGGNVLDNDGDGDGRGTLAVKRYWLDDGSAAVSATPAGTALETCMGAITISPDGDIKYERDLDLITCLQAWSTGLVEIFVYELEDDAGARASARLTVTWAGSVGRVSPTNFAPQVDCGIDDWNIFESWPDVAGERRSHFKTIARCAFEDPDHRVDADGQRLPEDPLTFAVSGLPSWAAFDSAKQAFRADFFPFTRIPEGERVSTVTVSATDPYGGTASTEFTLRHSFEPLPRQDKLVVWTSQDSASVNVLENDADYEGDSLSVHSYWPAGRKSVSVRAGLPLAGQLGTLTISPAGLATFVLNSTGRAMQEDYWRNEEFEYLASDGHAHSSARLRVTVSGDSTLPPAEADQSGPVALPDLFSNTQDWSLPRAGKKWTYAVELPEDGKVYRFESLPSWLEPDYGIPGKLAVSGIVPSSARQTEIAFKLVSRDRSESWTRITSSQWIRAFVIPSIGRASHNIVVTATKDGLASSNSVSDQPGVSSWSWTGNEFLVYTSNARPHSTGMVAGLNEVPKLAQDAAWTRHVESLTVEGNENFGTEYGYVERPVEWPNWERGSAGARYIAGKYGTLSIAYGQSSGSGNWTYKVEPDDPDVLALRSGETAEEAFVYAVRWRWSPAEQMKYGIEDPYYTSNPVLVRILITRESPANVAPLALEDEIGLSVASGRGNVIANDSDPDGDVLRVIRFWTLDSSNGQFLQFSAGTEAVTSKGRLTVNADGSAVFYRRGDVPFGTANSRFEYEITDGRGGFASQYLNVIDHATNLVARDDTMADPLPTGASVLANDLEHSGGRLEVRRYWQLDSGGERIASTETSSLPSSGETLETEYGTLTIASNGSVEFVNRSTWSRPESLQVEYEVSANGATASAVLTISVPPRLSPPATPLELPDLFGNTLDWKLPRAGKKWTYAISTPSDRKTYRFSNLPLWLARDQSIAGKLAVSGVAPPDSGQTEFAFSLVASDLNGTETSQTIRAFVVPSVFESSVSDKIVEYPVPSREAIVASGALEFAGREFEDVVVFTEGSPYYVSSDKSKIARDAEWVGHIEGLTVTGSESFGTEYEYVPRHHNWAGLLAPKSDWDESTSLGDTGSLGEYGHLEHSYTGEWAYRCSFCIYKNKLSGQTAQEVFVMAVRWKWTDAEKTEYGIESDYYVSNPIVIKIDLRPAATENEGETEQAPGQTAMNAAAQSALMAGAWSRMDAIREGGGAGSTAGAGLSPLLRTLASEIDGQLAWDARDAQSHRTGIVDNLLEDGFAPRFSEESLDLAAAGWRLWSGERRDGLNFTFDGESGSGTARTVSIGFGQAVSERLEVGALVERSAADVLVREGAIAQRHLTVSPYWLLAREGIRIWGTSGLGTGEITYNSDGFAIDSYHAGVGGEMELARLGLVETKGRIEAVSVFAEIEGASERTRASGARAELEAGLPVAFRTGSTRASVTVGRHYETIESARSGADFGFGFELGLDGGLSVESAASRLFRSGDESATYSVDGTLDPRNDGRGVFASLGYRRGAGDSGSTGLEGAAIGSSSGRIVLETGFVAAPKRDWVGNFAVEASMEIGELGRAGLSMGIDSGRNSLSWTAGRSEDGGAETGVEAEVRF